MPARALWHHLRLLLQQRKRVPLVVIHVLLMCQHKSQITADVWALKTPRDQIKVPFWRLVHGCGLHKRKIRPRGDYWGSDAWCHADTHKTHFPSEGLLEGSLPKPLAAEGHWHCFISQRLSVLLVAGGLSPACSPWQAEPSSLPLASLSAPAGRGEEPGVTAGG